ncbi:GsfR2 [Apiospora sp. TS-2023a]
MSLRRKSCDACYHGRRKCDRTYPICGTCRRTRKTCHFAYTPISAVSPDTNATGEARSLAGPIGHSANVDLPTSGDSDFVVFDIPGGDQSASNTPTNGRASNDVIPSIELLASWQHISAITPSPPRIGNIEPPAVTIPGYLGGLGTLQRVEGSTESWQWVINELKRFPHDLATRGETLFLHRELYRDSMPPAIRAAIGVSAMFALLSDHNRQMLFRVVDAEVLELLRMEPSLRDASAQANGNDGVGNDSDNDNNSNGLTLIEELARLQAFLLYQMMRLFGAGIEQRIVVEQQHILLTTWALRLLTRSEAEVIVVDDRRHPRASADDNQWHAWLVAESVRRTVLTVYIFYAMYSLATHGFCADFPVLTKLPVSDAFGLWHSGTADLIQKHQRDDRDTGKTLAYDEYTQSWAVSPLKRMDPFEKFLIVPCKGFEGIDTYCCSVG